MAVVSYNSGKMNSAIKEYRYALGDIEEIRATMKAEVNHIRENWKGNDANNAESDFKSIVNQMDSIVNNLTEIIKMFEEVASNFGQLKY